MQPVSRRRTRSSLAAGSVGLLAGCLNAFGGVQSDDRHVSRTADISGAWSMPDFDAANTIPYQYPNEFVCLRGLA